MAPRRPPKKPADNKVRALPAGAPKEAIRSDFARRLQRLIWDRGMNQSDLARAIETEIGRPFGRDNISHYIRGVSIPRDDLLAAMARALGVEMNDLIPEAARTSAASKNPPLEIRDLGDGNAWLRVNQAVPFDVAVKVMQLLNDAN